MPKLGSMLALLLLTMSLSGCDRTGRLGAGLDASAAGTAPAARHAAIKKDIAPACPTPTQWTADQRKTVADFVDKTAGEPGQQLEAPELKRLSQGAKVCRGQVP